MKDARPNFPLPLSSTTGAARKPGTPSPVFTPQTATRNAASGSMAPPAPGPGARAPGYVPPATGAPTAQRSDLAATEAYLFGVPAIAFSQVNSGWAHVDDAARVARDIVERFAAGGFAALPSPFLLNVNIPNLPYEQIGPLTPARLGRRHQAEPVIRAQDPRGREIFWIGAPGACLDAGEGTDFHATAQGRVSITPLQIDLTHKTQLDLLAGALP